MNKIRVVLLVLDKNKIESTLRTLNFQNAIPVLIITEISEGTSQVYHYCGLEIPMFPIASIQKIIEIAGSFIWLINGFVHQVSDIYKIKKFLVSNGVPEDNIVNFEVLFHLTPSWIANIRYIEKNPIDFFATGISYIEAGLNFQVIAEGRGAA